MCLLITQCLIFLSLKVPVGPGEDCTDAMHLRSMHLGHRILLSLSLCVHSLQASVLMRAYWAPLEERREIHAWHAWKGAILSCSVRDWKQLGHCAEPGSHGQACRGKLGWCGAFLLVAGAVCSAVMCSLGCGLSHHFSSCLHKGLFLKDITF